MELTPTLANALIAAIAVVIVVRATRKQMKHFERTIMASLDALQQDMEWWFDRLDQRFDNLCPREEPYAGTG